VDGYCDLWGGGTAGTPIPSRRYQDEAKPSPFQGTFVAKRQLIWKTGTTYTIRGASKMERRIVLVGRGKINGKETLFFKMKKKSSKRRSS
jgi:hypothetical protein